MAQSIRDVTRKLLIISLCLFGAVSALAHYIAPRPTADQVAQMNPPPGAEWFLTQLPRYQDLPLTTLLHVIPAALFMLLLLVQLSSTVRGNWPRLHKFNGWFLGVLASVFAVSGLMLGIIIPFGGMAETVVIGFYFVLFMVCLVQGIRAARVRQFAEHRRWMLRMVALAMAPVIMRPILSLLVVAGMSGPASFVPAILMSMALNMLFIEWYMNRPSLGARKYILSSEDV